MNVDLEQLADELLAGLTFPDDAPHEPVGGGHWYDLPGEDNPRYLPTVEEIKAACLEIQKEWSTGEEMRRRGARLVRDGEYMPRRSHAREPD